ncbi:MAG: aminotransferase [Chloroflexi bacterium]|nr:aminotransferase [Chloroflexota bacterium]|tara:strand:+ start:5412 stop:6581 length:1170 start_codon:yes stop_codon:yes gene_type:complete
MPGYELIDENEKNAINEIFEDGGCLFRYGFDFMRNNKFHVVEFEKNFSKFIGSKYSHAVSSGTAALLSVNKALGLKEGDEVITQSFTFVATVEAIQECGAKPVITEVDESLNMDPYDFESRITEKTKAVWVVHMMGVPANLKEIIKIADKYNISVLEDTAQGLGSKIQNQYAGTIGKAGIFSFDFGKTLTTGEGGMICTDDYDLYKNIVAFSDHGHEDNPDFPRGEDTAIFGGGFNYRMGELQGAIGKVQLKKFNEATKKAYTNKKLLLNNLKDVSEFFTYRKIHEDTSEFPDSVVMMFDSIDTRTRISNFLYEKGIGFKLLPGAVKWHFAGRWDHLWVNHDEYRSKVNKWNNSEKLLERCIAIPIMINMSENDILKIAQEIKNAIYNE